MLCDRGMGNSSACFHINRPMFPDTEDFLMTEDACFSVILLDGVRREVGPTKTQERPDYVTSQVQGGPQRSLQM